MFFNFLTYTYKYFTYVFRSHYLCLLTFLDLITYVYLRLLAPLLISRYLSITAITEATRKQCELSWPPQHRSSHNIHPSGLTTPVRVQQYYRNIFGGQQLRSAANRSCFTATIHHFSSIFSCEIIALIDAASSITLHPTPSSIHPKRPSSLTRTSSTALYCPKTFRLASKPSNFLRALTKLYHHGASQEKAEEWC